MDRMAEPASASTSPSAASSRTPGFDVARALAILGMVLVNFSAMAEYTEAPRATEWLVEQIEGKAAALFVTLAGIGVTLRVKSAERRGHTLEFEQRALLRRAAVLFVLGLVHRHFWEWDILHMYGVFLVCAAVLLRAPSWLLVVLAAALIALTVPAQTLFEYEAEYDSWTLAGGGAEMLAAGLFPAVPWLSFLLVGIVLGRLDLTDEGTRSFLYAACIPCIVALELLDTWAFSVPAGSQLEHDFGRWALAWPRPPTPAFALLGIVYAIVVVCLAIELTQSRQHERWVVALTATGQLALSVYLAHGVAITVAMEHGHFIGGSQLSVLLFGVVFYVVSVWFAWRWRVRWGYGPVELIVRQLSSGSPAAPWGGDPLAELPGIEPVERKPTS